MRRTLSFVILSAGLLFPACGPYNSGIDPAFAAVPIPDMIPVENTVLVVTGLSGEKVTAALDLDTIMKFPRTGFSSLDPWDKKVHEYTGVLLLPLLRRLGVPESSASIQVIAANGYRVSIRMTDLAAHGHLLAYHMDGKNMSDQPALLKRGTLSIAINFTGDPALDAEVYKNQLVWQVTKIAAE